MYNKKRLREEEYAEFEREEIQSMQEIYGHTYAGPFNPEENEASILLKITKEVIQECIDAGVDLSEDAEMISREILDRYNTKMVAQNLLIHDSKFKNSKRKNLTPISVCLLITSDPSIRIRKIRFPTIRMEEGNEQYHPGIREDDGTFSFLLKDGGNEKLNALIRRYNPDASKQFIAEVYACIRDSELVEKKEPTTDENLVPVNNGVWDFDVWEKTHDWKQAFISNTDPEYDKFTFMSKLPVDYIHDTVNPIIHDNVTGTDWDVMTWIDQLMNRDGKHPLHTQFLFELIHCAVRINTCFGMGVWFLDESKYSKGGQGKGTFCQLLRELVGVSRCKDTEVYYLEDPKKLSGLEKCNAIISDEASHHYIKHGANYKRLQRGEPVSVKTLYKDEYTAVFKGLILHCLNEPLTFGEQTGSVERTRVILTWRTSYTDPKSGFKENKKIKNDYVRRPEVLRYLLKYTLEEINITEFSKDCLDALEPNLQLVRNKTNAVSQFMAEHESEFVWDRIPFTYLFQLFCVWFEDTHNQKAQYKLDAFIDDVALWMDNSEKFEFHPQSFRPCDFMSLQEPLTRKYGLGYPWVTQSSLQRRYDRGERPLGDCVPPRDNNTTYKEGGLFRKGTKGTADYTGKDWNESEDGHPSNIQFVTTEFTKGKKITHNLEPLVIEKSKFMINEQEDRLILVPANMPDTQKDKWPLEIDKQYFRIRYTSTELWLVPITVGLEYMSYPIRKAIASITAFDSEEDADKQQNDQQ